MIIFQIRIIWRITIRRIRENCKRQNYQSADYAQMQSEMQPQAVVTQD